MLRTWKLLLTVGCVLTAVALVVSRDVWEGGVRAVSRAQVQGIYEGRILEPA